MTKGTNMEINNRGFINIFPVLKDNSENIFDLDVQVRNIKPTTGNNATVTCPNASCVSCTCQTDANGCTQSCNCHTNNC